MKRFFATSVLCIAAAAGCAVAGTTRPADGAGTPPGKAGGLPHIRIDKKNRTVEMDGRVVLNEGLLELLVCKTGGKDHESILTTDAKPSHLHAALLALGLTPGRPARWAKGPGGRPMFVPPAGARLHLSFRYTDAAGKVHTDPAHTWLLQREGEAVPAEAMEWVFVGSAMLSTGKYWADADGDVISVANFAAAVIDVPFFSARGNDALEFTANSERIPAVGTEVTVLIQAAEGAERAPVGRAEFDVDRFGRYTLDGLAITPEQVETWAPKFKQRHSHPYVVIRVAPRATMYDVERIKEILSLSQITDIDVFMRAMAGEMLPRTPKQLAEKMKHWTEQFADYRSLLLDPGDQAEVVLKQLQFRRRELEALGQLWQQYEKDLAKALKDYRDATRPPAPAEKESPAP